MKMRIYLFIVIIISVCFADTSLATEATTAYAQRDMLSLIKDGKGTITTDESDIGSPEVLFDGDYTTLLRSKNINPFSVVLLLDKPMEFDRVNIHFNGETHQWTMEIADSEKDLTGKGKSYRKIVDDRHIEGALDKVIFDKKFRARAFRLTAHRLTGDDYVHLFEWEFPVEQKIKGLEIQVLDYHVRSYPDLVEATGTIENTVISIKANVVLETGNKIDVTSEAVMTVDGEPWMDKSGHFLLTTLGAAKVVVEYGGFSETRELNVLKSRDYLDGKYVDFTNNETDLDVLFIERLPRIDYDAPNGGWPEDGSTVIWRAHVRNWGKETLEKVSCEFRMNGRVVKETTIDDFEPESTRTVDWEWKWRKSHEKMAFVIDTENQVNELSEVNNKVEDYIDAITLGLYVEEYLWRVAHEHQQRLGIGSNSFEDWGQRQVKAWNTLHENAVYPSVTSGVLDRIRLDRIVVVPNNALPLAGGIATNNPDNNDKTVDLMWGLESIDVRRKKMDISGGRDKPGWRNTEHSSYENVSWGHIHELNHARYIIDHYGFDVHPQQVKILLDDDTPLAGSKYFPKGMLHPNKYRGLMGGHRNIYDEYMALAWNRVAGQRARKGNCNAPGDIGEYLQLHPKKNTFQFVDEKGNPLSGAEILIYNSIGPGTGWYGKDYDNAVDYKAKLNNEGRADLPWTMFAKDGVIRHTYGDANSVVIVRVNHKGKVGFVFIECSDLNVEFMKGHTEHGHYVVTVKNLQVP